MLGVRFSRNFGKEAAVFAGMAQASGDVVAVMDCDLQHPPDLNGDQIFERGYDCTDNSFMISGNRGTR